MNRGLTVLSSFKAMKSHFGKEEVSEKEEFKANVLGWCVEWVKYKKWGYIPNHTRNRYCTCALDFCLFLLDSLIFNSLPKNYFL